MPSDSALKRIALITALAAVGVAAVLGIVALLGAGFGDTQLKILTTSLLVTASAVVALACAMAREAGRLGRLPHVGIAASVAGFAMMIVGLWTEPGADPYWKSAVTLLVASLAIAHAGLLDLARLPRPWPVRTAQILTGLAGLLIVVALWAEIDNEAYWRSAGVVMVLFAAGTVAVPILHRMAGIPAGSAEPAPEVTCCPFCGGAASARPGEAVDCLACGRRWRVVPA